MITQIGNYYLGQDIASAQGLKEFSEEEYATAETAGMKRMLDDEKFLNVQPAEFVVAAAEFAGVPWESLVIGSTKGKIYKLALQNIFDDSKLAEGIFEVVLIFFSEQMGKYNEHPLFSKKYIWSTPEGIVFLNKPNRLGHDAINLIITASFNREQAESFLKVGTPKTGKSPIQVGITWNPLKNTDEENMKWALLRAIEWGNWPLFLSQSIAPAFFIFFPWWKVALVFAWLNWLWSFLRYKYINIPLSDLGCWAAKLKWITIPGTVILLLMKHEYFKSFFCLIWPVLVVPLGFFSSGGFQIGILQKKIMNKFGYSETKKPSD